MRAWIDRNGDVVVSAVALAVALLWAGNIFLN